MSVWKRAVWAVLGGAALFALGLAGLWQAGWWSPGPAGRPVGSIQTSEPSATAPQSAPQTTPEGAATQAQELQRAVPLPPASGERQPVAPAQPAPPAPEPLLTPAEPTEVAPDRQPTSSLLAALNRVRARAGLGAVQAQEAWQAGCAGHARYLVREDRAEHRQDPASPFRSEAGEACAPGHYFVSSRVDSGPERALTYWVGGAFHLPQLIDPRLTHVAVGEAHDASGAFRSAVVLDVRRGLSGAARYPVRSPAPGQVAPSLRAATGEWPDALAGCPVVEARGAPVALLLGPQRADEVTGVTLQVNGRPLGACLLTAGTFTGANESETRVGRGVLAAQGAALALPDAPLPGGAGVQVSFQTARGPVTWAFRTQP